MKRRHILSLPVLLLMASTVLAENEIGLYFDEAGTQSLLLLDQSVFGQYIVSLHVILKNPTSGVSGFSYEHMGSGWFPGVTRIESNFLGGRFCQGLAHCDPNYWFVTQYRCPCVEEKPVILQTFRYLVDPSAGTITFDIEPTTCPIWRGFSYLPCGTTDTQLAIPFVRAHDAPATLTWGTVADAEQSFGAVKALF